MIKNWQAYTAVLIVIILVVSAGLWSQHYLERTAQQLGAELEPLLTSAYHESWVEVGDKLIAFQHQWAPVRKNWALVVVHFEIDQIERSLARVSQYTNAQDKPGVLAELGELKILIRHVPERERLSWRNLF
ncbi:MAG: DUF4363 family protein [Bacillota bacterium]